MFEVLIYWHEVCYCTESSSERKHAMNPIGWHYQQIISALWMKPVVSIWKVSSLYVSVDANGRLRPMIRMIVCFAHRRYVRTVCEWQQRAAAAAGQIDESGREVETNSASAWCNFLKQALMYQLCCLWELVLFKIHLTVLLVLGFDAFDPRWNNDTSYSLVWCQKFTLHLLWVSLVKVFTNTKPFHIMSHYNHDLHYSIRILCDRRAQQAHELLRRRRKLRLAYQTFSFCTCKILISSICIQSMVKHETYRQKAYLIEIHKKIYLQFAARRGERWSALRPEWTCLVFMLNTLSGGKVTCHITMNMSIQFR